MGVGVVVGAIVLSGCKRREIQRMCSTVPFARTAGRQRLRMPSATTCKAQAPMRRIVINSRQGHDMGPTLNTVLQQHTESI